MEDQLRLLENRKRLYNSETLENHDSEHLTNYLNITLPTRVAPNPNILTSTEYSDFESTATTDLDYYCYKRTRYTKGIKVTLSYTLKVSSSLREQGDQKRDIERVFEGDLETYQTSSQKIIKALDYLDSNLKSLQYTYSD